MPLVHRVKDEQARGRRILPFAKAGVSGRVPPRNTAARMGSLKEFAQVVAHVLEPIALVRQVSLVFCGLKALFAKH